MAKIKHNNFLETVNEVFTDATNEGVLHLYADKTNFSGRTIGVKNRSLYHFGTTGYLGLEQDHRLKSAAIDAIEKYGTQFPLSKTYVSNPLYDELEALLFEMYQHPIIVTKNSTLGHLGVIPSAVKDQDAIILDHQVHWSVQNAAKFLKNRSVPIDMIRHNDLNMLEDKIKSMSNSRKKIWYMVDGIYSMYGDFAPIKELENLCKKYPQLHLYIDDVHGMSWVGKNGTGYALSELNEFTNNMLLFGTLSKTFGASGAVLVCSDKKMHKEIKTFGGPLTFSAQLEPASVAAATASAKIHLSPEIYQLQNELKSKIGYFNELLKSTDLPLIDRNKSPVFYIGTGMPKTGYNFVNRLMKEGFFVNLGIFPAVPVKNTGVRITISRHNQKQEIEELVRAMVHQFPKALRDTFTTQDRVFHAFKLKNSSNLLPEDKKNISIQIERDIENINKKEWNETVGIQGVCDWEGLKFLQDTFRNNRKKEHNWSFQYIIIRDTSDNLILSTFVTNAIWKDDMLAKSKTSEAIEAMRTTDPYHLTSLVLSIGCLFTEGRHLFLDNNHPLKNHALNKMFEILEKLENDSQAKMIVLRDFEKEEKLHEYFQGQGFVRIQMPASCHIQLDQKLTIEEYCANLSSRNRRHLRREILDIENSLSISVIQSLDDQQLGQVMNLYNNVHKYNIGLNTFSFTSKLFVRMSKHPNWEFIIITEPNSEVMLGVMLCYNNQNRTYVPSFVGLNYELLNKYHTYRQLLYQTIKRAISLEFGSIDFGMTAAFEKRKLGANVVEKYAYIQTSDNYTLELMGLLEGN